MIEAKGAVTLQADITKDNPEAYALLDELGNFGHAIPFVAVFPADAPQNPEVLSDYFDKGDFLEVLRKCPDPSRERIVKK